MISSISVIEHIPEPDDLIALKQIWQFLRPGGRLFLSVPCAAEPFEEYVDFNEYRVLRTDNEGWVFGQRFYDEELLQSRIFRILGQPSRFRIFGENRPGNFLANRAQKVRGGLYPFWRESLMMGEEYCYFEQIREMPGLGVIAMEFIKTREP
jgi:SAM-dependent methyltransferase